jgi:hypothetical protein
MPHLELDWDTVARKKHSRFIRERKMSARRHFAQKANKSGSTNALSGTFCVGSSTTNLQGFVVEVAAFRERKSSNDLLLRQRAK